MTPTTETPKPRLSLDGWIDVHTHCSELERAALARGLLLLQKAGKLGAENRRGLGMVEINYVGLPDPLAYDDFLAVRKADILEYLISLEAIYAPGKPDRSGATEAGSADPDGADADPD